MKFREAGGPMAGGSFGPLGLQSIKDTPTTKNNIYKTIDQNIFCCISNLAQYHLEYGMS